MAEWTDSGDDNRRVTKGGSWLMESESTTSSASGLSKVDKKSDAIGLRWFGRQSDLCVLLGLHAALPQSDVLNLGKLEQS